MKFEIFARQILFLCAGVARLSAVSDAVTDPPVGLSNRPSETCEPPCEAVPGAANDILGSPAISRTASAAIPKALSNLVQVASPQSAVDLPALLRASSRFLAIEQGFRLIKEPGTRSGLKGGLLGNYATAAGSLHGWGDGDEFYVNYIGHPMQGSVSGFLWVQNDRNYRRVEFGKSRDYWKSRLRAAGFIWAYSTQFEIGPVSEASIGAIQAVFPQQGFVDHVITPSGGLGWLVAEDALDRYAIRKIETALPKPWIRLLARTTLNPTRTFANVLQGNAPWHRDTREGIFADQTQWRSQADFPLVAKPADLIPDTPGPPPFEFTTTFQPERLWGAGSTVVCMGGGATAAFRISADWQLAADVAGCKLLGLAPDLSGDSFTYMVGPRWAYSRDSAWSAHWQLLAGGHRMTERRMLPQTERPSQEVASSNRSLPSQLNYSEQESASGFAFATGGGVDYKLNRALAIRVAELSYRRSWIGPLGSNTYSHGLKLVSGKKKMQPATNSYIIRT
jgi:hypothetical protein